MINDELLGLIGNTPLVELRRFSQGYGVKLFAKLEMYNPSGSVKDRPALYMVLAAERDGRLRKGKGVIIPTSGNMGISLAFACNRRGYPIIVVMPDTMSRERMQVIKGLGAKLVLTDGAKGMKGAVEEAERMADQDGTLVFFDQFADGANLEAHYHTTGPEIDRQMPKGPFALCAGVGTGGTICGTARYLRGKDRDVRVVAVEPAESPVLSGGMPSPHKIQGIGAGFVPGIFDKSYIDDIVCVSYEEALAAVRDLAQKEGILAGLSSGAALAGAIKAAEKGAGQYKNIVVILPDSGRLYLSLGLWG